MSIYHKYFKEYLDAFGSLVDFELNFPDNFNFAYDVVDEIAKEEPNKKALVWCNTENEEHIFTFKDIKDYSNKYANIFVEDGIKKGDHVMVVLKRQYEYWFTAIALHKIGAIMIPATHMLTVSDFSYRIKKANVKAVICTAKDEVTDKIYKATKELELNIKLYCVQKDVEHFCNFTTRYQTSSTNFERIDTLATEPMLLYFTSGTTGEPKGVIHNYSYPLAHIITAKYWQQAEDDGLHFTIAETGWAKASWGKLYGQWLVGSAVMVYDFDNFNPSQIINIINKYRVTSFCAPPTVYRYLTLKGIPKLTNLKHASTAGEQLAPEIFDAFTAQTGLLLYEGYGQTETTLLMANFKGKEPTPSSMGEISPLYNIELQDANGKKVKDGELGEVVIILPKDKPQIGLFSSYLDNSEQYQYAYRGGVYHTGDVAYKDAKGKYWYHGRFDDLIKTGGFRVGPFEIEHILISHPAVLECSVIGVEDRLRSQAIKACIVLKQEYSASVALEKNIKEFCNHQLAEYKWIRTIEFVLALPKTISGKVKKNVLRGL